jgi:hypothetical protein
VVSGGDGRRRRKEAAVARRDEWEGKMSLESLGFVFGVVCVFGQSKSGNSVCVYAGKTIPCL